jgi:hypothetical protein
MSYYSYNVEKYELSKSYAKAEQNINDTNPYDDEYKSFETIQKETENILTKWSNPLVKMFNK